MLSFKDLISFIFLLFKKGKYILVVIVSEIFLEITDVNTSFAEHKYNVFSNRNPLDNNKSLLVVVITLSALFFNILSKSINLNGFDEKL